MNTLDERLLYGIKVFERLWPTRASRRARRAFASQNAAQPGLDLRGDPIEMEPKSSLNWSLAPDLRSTINPWPPTLESLLDRNDPLPACAISLGAYEDGLPFLLDLTNPAPGSLLIAGDSGSGKTRLLRSILASAILLNPEGQVAFYLVAENLDEYETLVESDHCQQSLTTSAIAVDELIQELSQVVYDRRRDKTQGPALILAIDDLNSCLEFLDDRSFTRLSWLIRHGPRSRVWTLAALSPEKAAQVDPRFLLSFRTRLVGSISDRAKAEELSGDNGIRTGDLERGAEFLVPFGEDWLRFWICDSQGEKTE